jgi:hypothetical protein
VKYQNPAITAFAAGNDSVVSSRHVQESYPCFLSFSRPDLNTNTVTDATFHNSLQDPGRCPEAFRKQKTNFHHTVWGAKMKVCKAASVITHERAWRYRQAGGRRHEVRGEGDHSSAHWSQERGVQRFIFAAGVNDGEEMRARLSQLWMHKTNVMPC